VPLSKPSFGFYDREEDSFTFSGADEMGMGMGDDLENMSLFLGSCLGDGQAMNGLWNMDFSGPSGW
jgi:hypothetical protein